MGLDMDFYKLQKENETRSYLNLLKLDPYKYFRKNYTIHEIMCLSKELEECNYKRIDQFRFLPYPYLYGGSSYKITKKQYEYIKKILKVKDLKKYIEDYDEIDNPKQLLKILKDFDKNDFYYQWVN